MEMSIEIKDVNQINPYARGDGSPVEGMLRQYHEFEEARAQLKFAMLNAKEKEKQRAANKHMAKKMA